MKIVHLCLGCFFIDNYSYQENIIPKYHVRMGHDVTVVASLVSFDNDGKPCLLEQGGTYMDKGGFKVIRIGYKKGILKFISKRLRLYRGLKSILYNEKPDLIFIHGPNFADIKIVRDYVKNNNIIVYADSHADWVNSARNFLSMNILYKIIWRYYVSLIIPYCKMFYGVLPIRCEFLNKVYNIPQNKISLLPLGVDDEAIPKNRKSIREKIRKDLSIPPEAMVVITGGKIDKSKNIHLLVDALNNDNDIHLIVFGVIGQDIKTNFDNLGSNIHKVGWCNSSQVIEYMISSDIACFPGTHSILWEQTIGLSLPSIFKSWNGVQHLNVKDNCIFINDISKSSILLAINKIVDNYNYYLNNSIYASSFFKYSEISLKSINS